MKRGCNINFHFLLIKYKTKILKEKTIKKIFIDINDSRIVRDLKMTSMIHKRTLKWIIPNFDYVLLRNRRLTSKIFTELKDENQVLSFKLILEYETDDRRSSQWIQFHLRCECSNSQYLSFRSNLSLSILNSSNQKSITISKNYSGKRISCEYEIGLIKKCKLLENLVSENLTLFFEMEWCFNLTEENLPSDNYKSFIAAEKVSDVTLHIGDKIIPAHKKILAFKSPVFYAMFSRDMSEANCNKAEIVDIDYDVFLEVLRFIYTGKVEKLAELALEILKAAHFYQINDLIIICTNSLSLNLNFNNAVDVLKVADKYECEELTNTCLIFIKLHFKSFQNSPGLKNLYESQHLLMEILNGLDMVG